MQPQARSIRRFACSSVRRRASTKPGRAWSSAKSWCASGVAATAPASCALLSTSAIEPHAVGVTEAARTALLSSGYRPRRAAATGVDALTGAERRVVELAARGQSNRSIAQSLFVTERTVELHLTNAYRKLEVSTRRDLASALEGGSSKS